MAEEKYELKFYLKFGTEGAKSMETLLQKGLWMSLFNKSDRKKEKHEVNKIPYRKAAAYFIRQGLGLKWLMLCVCRAFMSLIIGNDIENI